MITIAGNPFDPSALAAEIPSGSIQRQILDSIAKSASRYNFKSIDLLRFELTLRKEIVNAAIALHRSGMGFAIFQKTRCNTDFWDRSQNGGFRLKRGAVPAAAMKDIFINGRKYATECATAMVIVYYKAVLEAFGEEAFNKLFPSIYLMNWDISDPLLREVGTPKKVNDILLGDRGYFKNPDVDPETPHWQGENVIVLPDSLYYGHGVGILTADKIIQALNNARKANATRSAHFLDSVGNPDFQKLYNARQSVSVQPAQLVWKPFPPPIAAV